MALEKIDKVDEIINDLQNAFVDPKELAKMRSLRKATDLLETTSSQRKTDEDLEKLERERNRNKNRSDVIVKLLDRDFYVSLADSILGEKKEHFIDGIRWKKMMNVLRVRVQNLDGVKVGSAYLRNGDVTSVKSGEVAIVVTCDIFKYMPIPFMNKSYHRSTIEVRFDLRLNQSTRKYELDVKHNSEQLGTLTVVDNPGNIVYDVTTVIKDPHGKTKTNPRSYESEWKRDITASIVKHFGTTAKQFGLENIRQVSGFCEHGNYGQCNCSCFSALENPRYKKIQVNYLDDVDDNYVQNVTALPNGHAILFVRKHSTAFVTRTQFRKFAEHCGQHVIFLDEEDEEDEETNTRIQSVDEKLEI